MHEAESRSATGSLAVTLVALGGFLAAVGVFLGWWDVAGYRESEIFGRELVLEDTLAGTANWTGVLALVLGLVVGVLAIVSLLVGSHDLQRILPVAAMAGGLVILASAALGLLQATEVARASVETAELSVEGSAAVGLFLSAAGGALAALAGLVARREPAG
jgi:hypothetical protein